MSSDRFRIVPATAQMMESFEGLPPKTVRAVAITDGDEVVALGGYFIDQQRAVVFSKIHAKRIPAKTIARAGRRVVDMAIATGLPVIAVADENIPKAKRFMEWLGFEFGG